jgi:signal transduction histidine kinase
MRLTSAIDARMRNIESDSAVGGMQHLLNALVPFNHSDITRRIPPPRQRVVIEIYDTGIGIPGDRIDTIFGELHQLDPQREEWGWDCGSCAAPRMGLGHELPVRVIVGRGSRFRLVVPLGTARKP